MASYSIRGGLVTDTGSTKYFTRAFINKKCYVFIYHFLFAGVLAGALKLARHLFRLFITIAA